MSNTENDEDQRIPDKVIVVGRNRPRLSKIMGLLEKEQNSNDNHQHSVDYVPCLAAMDSYQDESGNSVRYLAQMVAMKDSGSTEPMTTLMDDDDFRNSLKCIAMVGYEWLADDQPHIEKYLAMYYNNTDGDETDSNTIPRVECVAPKEEYDTLQEEMEAFKQLDEDAKAKATTERTMGPGKMARCVMETYDKVVGKDAGQEETIENVTSGDAGNVEAETSAEHRVEEEPHEEQQPLHIDPNKPMFACRMCRTVLFGEDHLADNHIQSQHSFLHKHHQQNGSKNNNKNQKKCQSLFCDESVLGRLHSENDPSEMEGRLQCPNTKCNFKLGHWNWSGAQCSCGTWVVPAIQIPLSKVDVILPRNGNGDNNGVGAITIAASPIITPVLPRR